MDAPLVSAAMCGPSSPPSARLPARTIARRTATATWLPCARTCREAPRKVREGAEKGHAAAVGLHPLAKKPITPAAAMSTAALLPSLPPKLPPRLALLPPRESGEAPPSRACPQIHASHAGLHAARLIAPPPSRLLLPQLPPRVGRAACRRGTEIVQRCGGRAGEGARSARRPRPHIPRPRRRCRRSRPRLRAGSEKAQRKAPGDRPRRSKGAPARLCPLGSSSDGSDSELTLWGGQRRVRESGEGLRGGGEKAATPER